MPTAETASMKERKLALILSGAASLGSFEAGVLTELLYALDWLWKNGKTKYTLDVISGASAGAMTAALVGRALYDTSATKALHDAWVDRIDITALLPDPPVAAFLSKKVIREIANDYLGPVPRDATRALCAPQTLRLWFALANMNGVDYALPYRHATALGGSANAFPATFFADECTFNLSDRDVGSPDLWTQISDCAIASGNFPIAFEPAAFPRNAAAYAGNTLASWPDRFAFVDGGLFNNEPIGRAVELAWIADNEQIVKDRKFLLVDANLNSSAYVPGLFESSLLANTLRLLTMVRGEASALDWLQSQRRNTQIGWRDLLIDNLITMITTNQLTDPAQLRTQLDEACAEVVDHKRKLFPDRYPAGYLEGALKRTFNQNVSVYQLETAMEQDIATRIVFLLNNIGGLDKKAQLDIDILYAERQLMAGRLLASFGGFFKREWRQYDFDLGRSVAWQMLPSRLEVERYPKEPGATYDPEPRFDPQTVSMKDTDEDTRKSLRDSVTRKIVLYLKEVPIGPRGLRWLIGPISRHFIERGLKGALNRQLALS